MKIVVFYFLVGGAFQGFLNKVNAGEPAEQRPWFASGSHYTLRLDPRIRLADEAALRGMKAKVMGRDERAVREFKKAVFVLPTGTLTQERRKIYRKHLKNAIAQVELLKQTQTQTD